MWNGLAICTIFSHLLQDFSVVPLQTSCQHDKQSNANPTCKNQNSGHTDFWVPKFLVQQSTRRIWRISNLANAQAQENSNWFEHCIYRWIPHSIAQETPAKATSWRNAILHGMMQRQWRFMSSQVSIRMNNGKSTHRIWGTDPIKQQPLMLTDDFAPWHFASNNKIWLISPMFKRMFHDQGWFSWIKAGFQLVYVWSFLATWLRFICLFCKRYAATTPMKTLAWHVKIHTVRFRDLKYPPSSWPFQMVVAPSHRRWVELIQKIKLNGQRVCFRWKFTRQPALITERVGVWTKLNQISGSKQIHGFIAVESQNNTNCRLEIGVELVSLN